MRRALARDLGAVVRAVDHDARPPARRSSVRHVL
jgi:hypothetical protein